MALNIFEGARRIAILLGVLWSIGVLLVWYEEPNIKLFYKMEWPDQTPLRVPPDDETRSCRGSDGAEYFSRRTAKGTEVSVSVCFPAQKASGGEMMIPYRVDRKTGQWWGGQSYSTEVSKYQKWVSETFRPSAQDEKFADKHYWPERWKQVRDGSRWLVGGWFALGLITFITGWIVRGFAGIPTGKDRRD